MADQMSLEELERKAEAGDAEAQYQLGSILIGLEETTESVEVDTEAGIDWLKKSVDQDYVPAQRRLGSMYMTDVNAAKYGVEKDYVVGNALIQKAAESGDPRAQLYLGLNYRLGNGVSKDDSEGVKWFHLAAEQGDAEAHSSLGMIYKNGSDVGVIYNPGTYVTRDLGDAWWHYKRAVELGRNQDQEIVDEIDQELRGDAEATTRQEALDGARLDESFLSRASDEFRADREIVMLAVTQHGANLKYASYALRADSDIVLASLNHRGESGDTDSLQYAADELRSDQKFIFKLISVAGFFDVFGFAAEHIRANRETVLSAIEIDSWCIASASEELRADREVVMAALFASKKERSRNDDANRFSFFGKVSDNLRSDREVVMTAVESSGDAFNYASDTLRADKEIVLKAIKSGGVDFQYASEALRADREVVLAAVNNTGNALKYASKKLRADREIVDVAVSENPLAVKFASEELRADRKLMSQLVQVNGVALTYASKDLQADRDLVVEAVKSNSYVLKFLSEEAQNDNELQATLENMRSQHTRRSAERQFPVTTVTEDGHDLSDDRDFILRKVEENGLILEFASDELRNDPEVVLTALKAEIDWDVTLDRVFHLASTELKDSLDFIRTAVKTTNAELLAAASIKVRSNSEFLLMLMEDDAGAAEFVIEELWSKRQFVMSAIEKTDGRAFCYVSSELCRDQLVLKLAVKGNGQIDKKNSSQGFDILRFYSALRRSVSGSALQNDKEFILELIKFDGMSLCCASDELRADREVVLAAVTQFGQSLQCASEELQNDQELIDLAKWTEGKDLSEILESNCEGLPVRLIFYDD